MCQVGEVDGKLRVGEHVDTSRREAVQESAVLVYNEGRKARSTKDQLASFSNFHIMHYVHDITNNKRMSRGTPNIMAPRLRASCESSSTGAEVY